MGMNLHFLTLILLHGIMIMIVQANADNHGEFIASDEISLENLSKQNQIKSSKPALYIFIKSPKKTKQDMRITLSDRNFNSIIDDSTVFKKKSENNKEILTYERSQFIDNKLRKSIFQYFSNSFLNTAYKNGITNSIETVEKEYAIPNNSFKENEELKTLNEDLEQHAIDDIFQNKNIVIEVEEFEGNRDEVDIDKYISKKFTNFIESQKQSHMRQTRLHSQSQSVPNYLMNQDDIADVSGRWKTPISIVNAITSVKGETNMEWETEPITVHLARSEMGDIQLWWAKAKDTVYLQKVVNDGIDQDWCFDDVHVNIILRWKSDGSIISVSQLWQMGDSEMKYTRDINRNISVIWKDGKNDEESLKKYQHFISAWCDKNGALFDAENCAIYDK